jgi:UDP-glucose 4-epimerase
MRNVLVTGNAGYIGQHLVKLLAEHGGYNIYGQDLNYMSREKHQPLYGVNITDIQDTNSIYKIEFDSVVHLAALVRVGESVEQPARYYRTNISGSMNLIDNLSYDNFVFASTGAAEKMSSPYAISKKVIEDYIKDKAQKFTTFRFYNVVGSEYGIQPTNPDGILSNLIKAKETGQFTIHGDTYPTKDGTCVREYVHVMDICRAIIKAIEKPTNQIENLAYGDTRTAKEIVDIFKDVNDVEFKTVIGPARDGDAAEYFLKNPSLLMERNYSYSDLFRI